MTMQFLPVRQIAYVVPDILLAAEQHHQLHQSGPFYFAEHISVSNLVHRGVPATVDQSIAFGQWGEVMVEFVCQHNDTPSYIHDVYPFGSGSSGLHHIALIVDDLPQALDHYAGLGFAAISQYHVGPPDQGFDAAFIDTRKISGHMIEIYPKSPTLLAAYQMCRDVAGAFSTRPMFEKVEF